MVDDLKRPGKKQSRNDFLGVWRQPYRSQKQNARSLSTKIKPMPTETPTRLLSEVDAPESPRSVASLARALDYDVDNIYQWVYSNIDYFPMWGLHKGDVGTLIDQIGGSFDQANLMIALLRYSGYTANFAIGSIRLLAADVEQWLGTDDSTVDTTSADLLSAGQIGNTPDYSGGSLVHIDINQVWVQVTIDGTDYVFDPSYKTYNYTSGIDVGSILDYDATALISAAQEGSTVTADSITNLNADNIRSSFTTYSTNLLGWIQANDFAANIDEIIGGREIQALPATPVRQTSLPNQTPSSTPTIVSTLPSTDFATFRVQMTGLDTTFTSAEIFSQRLTIEFNDSLQPVLTLNGAITATGDAHTSGDLAEVTFTITHPFSTSVHDQTWTQLIFVESGSLYILGNSWGPSSQGMVDYHRWLLNYNKATGSTDSDESVLGEALAVFFFMSSTQRSQVQRIYNQLGTCLHLNFHFAGIVGFNSLLQSPYTDFGGIELKVQSRNGNTSTANNVQIASELVGNGLDSGIIQQNTLVSAVGADRFLDVGNSDGQTIYDATSANWATISAALSNWDTTALGTLIDDGFRIIIHQDGATSDSDFSGGGYLQILDKLAGTVVGVAGGSTTPTAIAGGASSSAITNNETNTSVINGPNQTTTDFFEPMSSDGVGLCSGAYKYKHCDISTGNGTFPFLLQFVRSYSSSKCFTDGVLGLGWTHNFNSYVRPGSNGSRICGEFSPKEAATTIAHAYVMLQLGLNDSPSLTQLLIGSESTLWLTDAMTNNAVLVDDGGNSREYVQLIDGTYNPSPGYADSLSISDGTFTLTDPQQRTWSFDTSNLLSAFKDPSRLTGTTNSIQYTYTDGMLVKVDNGNGRNFKFFYSDSRLSTVLADGFNEASFFVDLSGNLESADNYVYAYGGLPGLITQVFIPFPTDIAFVTNSYDSNLLVSNQIGSDTGNYTFNFAGARTEVIDPMGNTFVRYRNGLGSVLLEINELGQEIAYTRDGLERISAITYPEQNSLSLTYDQFNNVMGKTWHPKPTSGLTEISQNFTYDSTWNKLTTFEDGEGNTTGFSYDPSQGTLLTISRPVISGITPTVTFTYDSLGRVLTRTDETGTIEKYDYTLFTVTNDFGGLNLVTKYGYDATGNVTSIIDANQNKTIFGVSSDTRQMVNQSYPQPITSGIIWEYNTNGRLFSLQQYDGKGTEPINYHIWQYSYLTNGLIQSITNPLGNILGFEYDSMARLISRTDFEQNRYEFGYDSLSRVISITDASNTLSDSRTYTENGRLATRTDASGNITSFEYDGFDRLSKQNYPDATFEQYTYDNNNNVLTFETRDSNVITNTYDVLGRLSTRQPGSMAVQSFSYDLAGRLTGVSTPVVMGDPGSGSFEFAYDTAGRLYQQTMPGGNAVTFELDANGNQTRLTWPDGYYTESGYDWQNRLTFIKLNGEISPTIEFEYDGFSRRNLMTYNNGCNSLYGYSASNDLTWQIHNFVGGAATFGYAYNAVHQITNLYLGDSSYRFEPSAPASHEYAYANNLNQYPAVDSTAYTYNTNGCLISGPLTASFDVLNRMTEAVVGSTTNTYLYDPLNRQVQKSVSGTIQNYLYNGQELIATYDDGGTLIERFIRSDRPDEVLMTITSDASTFHHHDCRNTIIADTDTSGAVLNKFAFSAFGKSANISNSGFGFTGQRFDSEIGLYFYKSRYYSPQLGRFLQPDPLGFDGGDLNLYTYVNNDPLSRIDRLGLFPSANEISRPPANYGFDAVVQSNLDKQTLAWLRSNPYEVPTLGVVPKGVPSLTAWNPCAPKQQPLSQWYVPVISEAVGESIALVTNRPSMFPPPLLATDPPSILGCSGETELVSNLDSLGQLWLSQPSNFPTPAGHAKLNYYNYLWIVQNNLLPNQGLT